MPAVERYQILDSLPLYGPMYIPVTGNGKPNYTEGLSVRLYPTEGEEWVANFESGNTEFSSVCELDNGKHLLIIANGAGYIMDPDNPTPVYVLGRDYTCLLKSISGRFVLLGKTSLTIIERDLSAWDSQRIGWDGIDSGFKDLIVVDNIVSGFTADLTGDITEWRYFTYDIDTKQLEKGRFASDKPGNKPWWKFW